MSVVIAVVLPSFITHILPSFIMRQSLDAVCLGAVCFAGVVCVAGAGAGLVLVLVGVFCACVLIAKRHAIAIGSSFFISFNFSANLMEQKNQNFILSFL